MKVKLETIVNQVFNIGYTAIFFTPIILFWKDYYTTLFFKISLGTTICSFFLPHRCYTFFQISDSKNFYKKIGIPFIQQFTQQGKFAKRLTTYLGNNVFQSPKGNRINKLKNQIRTFETFHWACFIFFSLTAAYAYQKGSSILTIFILTSNILYNVIPILIQQYNRIRLNNISK